LAGAQELFLNPALAEATAESYAATNTSGLVFNDAVVTGVQITQEVRRNAPTGFSGVLSFGEPEVSATATARIAGSRLPGPGVTCLGVEVNEHGVALGLQTGVDVLLLDDPGLVPYLTTLRLGAGQPNAGYVDILGSENQTTRDCLANGSANPLDPTEETQTGVATGQALQGLQSRMEVARIRGCFTWDEIRLSILAADSDRDGIADDGTWHCNPLFNQGTAMMLMPVVDEDFLDQQGTIPVNLHDQGSDRPYLLTMFFLDAERTFEDTAAQSWKFLVSGGQGEAEIVGVFVTDAPTTLSQIPPDGGGGALIDCSLADSVFCFVQLID